MSKNKVVTLPNKKKHEVKSEDAKHIHVYLGSKIHDPIKEEYREEGFVQQFQPEGFKEMYPTLGQTYSVVKIIHSNHADFKVGEDVVEEVSENQELATREELEKMNVKKLKEKLLTVSYNDELAATENPQKEDLIKRILAAQPQASNPTE